MTIANEVDDLFEPSRQELEGLGHEYEEIGLGLTVTWRAVDAMNGTIYADPQKGEGTRFAVRLRRVSTSTGGKGAPLS